MSRHEVRDIEHKYNLWGGYRDELVATAMTLSLVVVGSFVVAERLLFKSENSEPTPTVTAEAQSAPQTLGAQDPEPTVVPQVQPPTASPTPQVELVEVPYGEDGVYEYEAYTISFKNPVLQFDKLTNAKRKLRVQVWLKNKNVQEGLPARFYASVVKDGVVIVPKATLYVAASRRIQIGEEAFFEATLPLIEATDVRELMYQPNENQVAASHFLYP